MTGDLLTRALSYAAAGWPVHPCRPGSKEPDTAHGFKDASTDPEVIRSWWAKVPGRNVAIATGAPGPDVLDVDTGPAGSGWAAFGALKRAGLLAGASALVRTRSGGLHVYFPGTDQPCGRLPRQFLDFKASGGYVVAPPSFVEADDKPAGAYELIEHRAGTAHLDWQAARCLLDPSRAAGPARAGSNRAGGSDALIAWVAGLEAGSRNDGLFWAACRMVEAGHSEDLDQLAAAAVQAGLSESEAFRTIASASRKASA